VTLDRDEIGAVPVEARPTGLKRKLQMVFQNPDSTLNPSHSVGYSIARAVRRLKGLAPGAARREPKGSLESSSSFPNLHRENRPSFPAVRSSGSRSRRALAAIRMWWWPTSRFLRSMCRSGSHHQPSFRTAGRARRSLIFISHDLAVVRYLADDVAVMYLGKVVESGPADACSRRPGTPTPRHCSPRAGARSRPPPCAHHFGGNAFARKRHRLPVRLALPRKLGAICDEAPPATQHGTDGHRIACHIPLVDLTRLDAAGPPRGPAVSYPTLHSAAA